MPDSFLAAAIILCFPEPDKRSVIFFPVSGVVSFRIFVGSFFLVQLHCCEFLLKREFHLKSPSYGFGAAPMDGFPGIHPSLLLLLGPVRGVHYNFVPRFLMLIFVYLSSVISIKAASVACCRSRGDISIWTPLFPPETKMVSKSCAVSSMKVSNFFFMPIGEHPPWM